MRNWTILALFVALGLGWLFFGPGDRDVERASPLAPTVAGEPDGSALADAGSLGADTVSAQSTENGTAEDRRAVPGAPAPESTLDEQRGQIQGLVLDSLTGVPIPDASVVLIWRIHEEFNNLDLSRNKDFSAVGETSTDESGRFELSARRDVPLELEVRARGFASARREFVFAGDDLTLRLDPGAVFQGRITRAADDEPLPDVELRAWTEQRVEILRGTTDNGGAFRFEGLEAGLITLEVTPPVHAAPAWQTLELIAGKVLQRDFALKDGVTIHGTVTDKTTGRPIQGAEVGDGWTFERIAMTDAKGQFELPGFGGPGVYDVHARARGYGEEQHEFEPDEMPDVDTELHFALHPANGAFGRVINSQGQPLEGVYCAAIASKFLDGNQYTDYESTDSDAQGRFDFHSLNPRIPHQVALRHPGYGMRTYDFPNDEDGSIDLGTFQLFPAGTVRGRLVDEDENPLPDYEVILDGTNDDVSRLRPTDQAAHTTSYSSERDTRTDSLGRFAFADVAAGSYELRSRLRENRDVEATDRFSIAEGQLLENRVLLLRVGESIGGRVVSPEGTPLGGIRVMAWKSDRPREYGVSAKTGPEGRFRLRGLEVGSYRLQTDLNYYNWQNEERPLASAPPVEANTDDADVTLQVFESELIRTRLVDNAGNPVDDRWVQILEAGTEVQVAQGWTDAEGRFSTFVRRGGRFDAQAHPIDRNSTAAPVSTEDGKLFLFDVSPGAEEHVFEQP